MPLSLVAVQTQAEPGFAQMYRQQFGYPPSCNACHTSGGGSKLNAYGEQFKSHGKNAGAFEQIAKLDADGDGFSNDDEAKAKANPGSKASTPKNPGDWLDV